MEDATLGIIRSKNASKESIELMGMAINSEELLRLNVGCKDC